jgi:GNAT superfamily N-acetyltransferase
MNISIRALTKEDDEQANDLLNLAFNSETNRLFDLKLYRRLQPDGWFAATLDGLLIGTVGAISYGIVAHIGFMTVHPDLQAHGIGSKLMEHILAWLDSQNVPLVTLDASKKGFPLYQKLGFFSLDETVTFVKEIEPVNIELPESVQQITPADLDELVELDKPIFGADRRKVFQTMTEFYPSRGFLHRGKTGRITGYLFAYVNRIGPWVMADLAGAEVLLQTAMTLEYINPVVVCVPSVNQNAVKLVQDYGFEKLRTGQHMAKGDGAIPGDRTKIFAQTSMGAG